MSRLRLAGALALALVPLVAGCEKPPPLVRDDAELLAPAEERLLAEHHRLLEADHDVDYRVVTGRGFRDLDAAAAEAFAALRVGSASASARGLLLMIDAEADRVRVEVGYALEGTFPDAFVAYVEARQMVPFFRSGRVADGILATTELIVDRVQRAKARGGFEDEVWFAGSGGGGAAAPAEIGEGYERPEPRRPSSPARTGGSPTETLGLYLSAMAAHDGRPDLPLYTAETRAMLAGWTTTRAQMDHLVESYRRCGPSTERRDPADRLAVVRYPIASRQCAPWFLRRDGSEWQLDLTMMQTAIRFGRDNSWRLLPEAEHPYGFAFEDWSFDRHGFPRDPG